MAVTATEIVAFWAEAGPARWFAQDPEFDATIAARFGEAHHAAARGERSAWEASAEGSLALLLLLDQFPRNLFRGSAHAFATDPLARRIANRAMAAGHDQVTAPELRVFFYLPFEHSECLADQDRCVALCAGLPHDGERWARVHRDIIARFGRFPHRNAALGREISAEEQAFLDNGGFQG